MGRAPRALGLAALVAALLALPSGAEAAEYDSKTSCSLPDYFSVPVGGPFTVRWTVTNTGTEIWRKADHVQWVLTGSDSRWSGNPMVTFDAGNNSPALDLGDDEEIKPNETKEWSVQMIAPKIANTYWVTWSMGRWGGAFGQESKVWIITTVDWPIDNDLDGKYACINIGDPNCDCDDNDPTVNQDAKEICDGKDNNCNNLVDENLTRECFAPCKGTQVCQNGQWSACDGLAGEPESCDGIDNDCNGIIDDGDLCWAGAACVYGVCVYVSDAGNVIDAGKPDAGKVDAGVLAGRDASSSSQPGPSIDGACGCSTGSGTPLALIALVLSLMVLGRRRWVR